MERETVKLVNVLRSITRAASYAEWAKSEPDGTRFCVAQYNKVLARLGDLEPNIKTVFIPLGEDASAQLVRVAARELVAYFEDEAPGAYVFRFDFRCGSRKHARGRARYRTTPLYCE